VPWLVAAALAFRAEYLFAGLLASFVFFLTALRQAHGAQHYSLGLGRGAQDVLLAVLSVLMLASLHALQATHMHHHKDALGPTDVEGSTAATTWWRALLGGPWFIVALHVQGVRLATARQRRWIVFEGIAIGAWIAVTFAFGAAWLQWFVIAMAAGECLTGFFAVWTVLEHHLFPAVPTPRLPELARRLERVLPEVTARQVY